MKGNGTTVNNIMNRKLPCPRLRLKQMLILILSVLLIFSVEASGVAKLEKFVSDIKTLKADFTQQSVSDNGTVTRTSSGVFMLSKPGKFSWIYSTPYVQKIITNGEQIWIYDPDLEQVTIRSFTEAMSASPIALLTQQENLSNSFIVQDIEREEDDLEWVSLKPKTEDADFLSVHIGLDDKGIKAMDLFDQFGQQNRIRFLNIEVNPEIDNRIYKFTPPEGVDVIGGTS